MADRSLKFAALKGDYAVCRWPASAPVPAWTDGMDFLSITRTADELSVVTSEERLPEDVDAERGWFGFRVAGVLAFSEIGILSTVASLLAGGQISVLAVSTFETDYFFVPGPSREAAYRALVAAGHVFEQR